MFMYCEYNIKCIFAIRLYEKHSKNMIRPSVHRLTGMPMWYDDGFPEGIDLPVVKHSPGNCTFRNEHPAIQKIGMSIAQIDQIITKSLSDFT